MPEACYPSGNRAAKGPLCPNRRRIMPMTVHRMLREALQGRHAEGVAIGAKEIV